MKTVIGIRLLAAGLFALSSIGCSSWDRLNDKEKGAVIGGGSGAVLGSAVAPGVGGTLVGGALGAVAGGVVGNEMDKSDRERERRRRY